jgi:uncharacterized coiled-coil DUF342 family protein|tara:strand:+ start:7831 stop:8343 length:513 start_codon:yes stop_codon:yes gene_type:complete
MPCKQCKDKNYKYGNTGECKYATKEACEKANPKKYNKMQPTPLGKKSYEEYEKELKEYNLSKVERVELALVDDLVKDYNNIKSKSDALTLKARKAAQDLDEVSTKSKSMLKEIADAQKTADEIVKAAKGLGVELPQEAKVAANQIDAYRSDMSEVSSTTAKASDLIFGLL